MNNTVKFSVGNFLSFILCCCVFLIFLNITIQPITITAKTFNKNDLLTLDHIEINSLYDINIEFIRTGFANYYKTGDRNNIRNIIVSKGFHVLSLYIDAHLISSTNIKFHRLVRILACARHVWSDLWCVYQQEHNDITYEYWLLKEWVRGRDYGYMQCEFIITQTKSKLDKREIIHKSNQFFDKYKIDDNFTILFPENDFKAVYLAQGFTRCPK